MELPKEIEETLEERFQPVIKEIDTLLKSEADTILIGIDGRCGSGKSTLGEYIKQRYDCNVFHMDDFFLQMHQRTPARLLEIGGNVDYERFLQEVLEPLLHQKEVSYRPFRCSMGEITKGTIIPYKRLNLVEGSYSLHPYFNNPYQLNVFLTMKEEEQKEVIRIRNGEVQLERFIQEWIPKEEHYFDAFDISKGCLCIPYREK